MRTGSDVPSATEREAVEAALLANRDVAGPLLPVLHDIQHRLGCVPPHLVQCIADALNQSPAEVHGVLSFYHDFRSLPPGRVVVQICCAEACQATGALALQSHAQRALGTKLPGTTSDGRFTLAPAYCLGNCACGPSLMVDGELHAHVTPERFDELIAECTP